MKNNTLLILAGIMVAFFSCEEPNPYQKFLGTYHTVRYDTIRILEPWSLSYASSSHNIDVTRGLPDHFYLSGICENVQVTLHNDGRLSGSYGNGCQHIYFSFQDKNIYVRQQPYCPSDGSSRTWLGHK